VHRWVRTSARGHSDPLNVSTRKREGWEPVKSSDYPELQIISDENPLYAGGVQVGGLMLCKTSKENSDARNAYYREVAEKQMESVDNSFMRENDPRMPLLQTSRKSRTTFGSST
jgi:hypothetical protein